jgi:hypothetical protein
MIIVRYADDVVVPRSVRQMWDAGDAILGRASAAGFRHRGQQARDAVTGRVSSNPPLPDHPHRKMKD